MKFAIRDDDISYFTSPKDLEEAYDFIDKGCISLSIVPNTYVKHKDNVYPYGEDIVEGYYRFEENINLVEWLKAEHKNRRIDVLLHGYSHEYKLVNGKWKAEMLWKDGEQLERDLSEGKRMLEKIFNTPIKVFVAPNNHINKKGIKAVYNNDMNYSGTIQHFDRPFSLKYLCNYIYRWGYRLAYGISSSRPLDYKTHIEIQAYSLDNFERLKREYIMCKKRGYPFVVYTHYWNLLKDRKSKDLLERIYNYAIEDGAELVSVSECFDFE